MRLPGLCIALLLSGHGVTAGSVDSDPAPGDGKYAQLQRRIDEYLASRAEKMHQRYGDRSAFSGALAVAVDGQVVAARTFGYANREWLVPTTLDTKFRIWSISKIFTAVALMKLQEQGKLDIDDPVCSYLDRCPSAWHAITIRHVLSLRSGLSIRYGASERKPDRGGISQSGNKNRRKTSPEEIIEEFGKEPLEFEPGTSSAYSNLGFFVAGLVIEKAAGKSYEEALKELIFLPLGMNDTGMDHPETILPKRASYYEDIARPESPGKFALNNAEYYDMPSWMFSAGALYSTVGDFLKFDRALYSGAVLSQETLQEMWSDPHYGLGWETRPVEGRRCYGHVGAGLSTVTRYSHFPDDRVAIVILPNSLALGSVMQGLPAVVFEELDKLRKSTR